MIAKDAPVRDEAYRRFVAAQPCFACGIEGFSQCAHSNSVGKGLSIKASDHDTFPLCGPRPFFVGCHAELDSGAIYDRNERRAIEAEYVERMRVIARAEGWDV